MAVQEQSIPTKSTTWQRRSLRTLLLAALVVLLALDLNRLLKSQVGYSDEQAEVMQLEAKGISKRLEGRRTRMTADEIFLELGINPSRLPKPWLMGYKQRYQYDLANIAEV